MTLWELEQKLKRLEKKIKCIPKVTQEYVNSIPDINSVTFPTNPCEGFIHMVEFKSGSNNWLMSYRYENQQWIPVISIVGQSPDISPTIPQPVSTTFTIPQTREGYIQIGQSNGAWGLVEVVILKPTDHFTLSILPGTISSASTDVSNPTWTIVEDATSYTLTKVYPAPDTTGTRIGYSVTSFSAGAYSLTAQVTVGSGDEVNISNNNATRIFTAS